MWNRNDESLVSSMTGRLPPSATDAPTAVGQTGAEVAEVLVPDDVARFRLRVGPLKDDRRAAVADHDAPRPGTLWSPRPRSAPGGPGCVRWAAVSASSASWSASCLIQRARSADGERGRVLQRVDQLRHHAAQVSHQRHVHRSVHADRRRVLLDVDPLAGGVVACPMLGLAVVHGLAEFGAQRDAHVGCDSTASMRPGRKA